MWGRNTRGAQPLAQSTLSSPTLFYIAFALGVVALQYMPQLPPWPMWYFLLPALLPAILLKQQHLYLFFILLCGFAYADFAARARLQSQLPLDDKDKIITLAGEISGLPKKGAYGTTFIFKIKNHTLHKTQLYWPGQNSLAPGQIWRLKVRLEAAQGLANPGGFDMDRWFFAQGINATGRVLEGEKTGERLTIDTLRQKISQRIARHLENPGFLQALLIGDTRQINEKQWQVFRDTGTIHMLSISGMHLTFFFTMAAKLAEWLWRRKASFCLFLPAQKAGIIIGLTLACIYAFLAGLSMPTLRALLQALALGTAFLMGGARHLGHALLMALVLSLLVDPFAPLTISFWLSFGAVALIGYMVFGRFNEQKWMAFMRLEAAFVVAMLPLLVYHFGKAPLISPIANTLAVTTVNFIVIPLGFIGLIFPPFLLLAEKVMHFMYGMLSHLASTDFVLAVPEISVMAMLFATLGALWLLAPPGLPWRFAGSILFLPLFFPEAKKIPEGVFIVHVLDVGQGLATVIETKAHILIYDTGPNMGDTDASQRVLLPFLDAKGIKNIDTLVLSHNDSDHTGGAQSLLTAKNIQTIHASFPFASAQTCTADTAWQWDGVHFAFLTPFPPEKKVSDNDRSCVLKISSPYGNVLLPGDLGHRGEQVLLERNAPLAADLLLAGHHGSKSSSGPFFLGAVHPKWVAFSAGNRFHHPHDIVVYRLQKLGAQCYSTSQSGALSFIFQNNPEVSLARKKRYYWQYTIQHNLCAR